MQSREDPQFEVDLVPAADSENSSMARFALHFFRACCSLNPQVCLDSSDVVKP